MKRDKLGVLTWRLLRQRQRSDLYDNYRDNYRASAESAAGLSWVELSTTAPERIGIVV